LLPSVIQISVRTLAHLRVNLSYYIIHKIRLLTNWRVSITYICIFRAISTLSVGCVRVGGAKKVILGRTINFWGNVNSIRIVWCNTGEWRIINREDQGVLFTSMCLLKWFPIDLRKVVSFWRASFLIVQEWL
jgi:hypothetical protein